jgi:C-terminal binding-module, SLH-like, of glucodextranase
MPARLRWAGAATVVLCLAGGAVPAAAQTGNVTVVRTEAAPSERPGPPILYAPPATAPQLTNAGIWKAPPILVSGTAAYRDGEYLYQGFLYDDHGARGQYDPGDRRNGANDYFSLPAGSYTYPSDPAYAENAADLVELRVKPLHDATAFRFTLNTMKDPSLVAMSLAIASASSPPRMFPLGANVSAPADLFVTVHPGGAGEAADVVDASSRSALGVVAASVDVRRRQVEMRVPHALWNPATSSLRLAAGVGLWDRTQQRYLLPQAASSATVPGGGGGLANPAAFFDVAFRFHEPYPLMGSDGMTQHFAHPAFWRDQQQADVLATGDITPFVTSVDFAKLAARVDDDTGVPQTGAMDRILASRFEPNQGVNYASSCYQGDFNCQYQGNLQPYAIYVPNQPAPAGGYGMTLLLHANSTNYNEFFATRNQSELGERGPGSIVITPQARDPAGGDYSGYAAADVFEVWSDVAHRYRLDPSWNAISGYSMGSLGTYKLAEQFPDLFARAVGVVASPGGTPETPVPYTGETAELASLRNVPLQMWDVAPVDELNPLVAPTALALQQLGYRYDWLELPGDHLTLMYNDEYAPAATFLGTAHLEPNPPHITYVYDVNALDMLQRPFGDVPRIGLVADHAYWLSGLRLATATQGSVDAVSHGLGAGGPTASGMQHGTGTLGPGRVFPLLPYAETSQTWSAAPPAARADELDLVTRNLRALTVDVARAGVDCNAAVHVDTDVPVTVTLAGCADAAGVHDAAAIVPGTARAGLPNTGGPAGGSTAEASFGVVAAALVARRRRRGRTGSR